MQKIIYKIQYTILKNINPRKLAIDRGTSLIRERESMKKTFSWHHIYFPLKPEAGKHVCSDRFVRFNIALQVQCQESRTKKKKNPDREEAVKSFLCRDNLAIYVDNPKEATEKFQQDLSCRNWQANCKLHLEMQRA